MGLYRARDLLLAPSLLSLMRLPLAVAFVVTVRQPPAAFAVLALAAATDVLDGYLAALRGKDPWQVKWAHDAVATENNVVMPIGEGHWGTLTKLAPYDLRVADPVTGQVHEDEPRVPGQLRHLLAPETGVACPAVDKHNRVTAFAFDQVVDFVRAEGDEVGFAGAGRVLRTSVAGEQEKGGGDGGKDGFVQRGLVDLLVY